MRSFIFRPRGESCAIESNKHFLCKTIFTIRQCFLIRDLILQNLLFLKELKRERQDINRTIFLLSKILCESLHLSHKSRLVLSARVKLNQWILTLFLISYYIIFIYSKQNRKFGLTVWKIIDIWQCIWHFFDKCFFFLSFSFKTCWKMVQSDVKS